MADLTGAILQGFADRYNPEKMAVTRMLNAESRVNETKVPTAKLSTGQGIRKELKKARKEKKPDQDYINFLAALLKEVEEI